MDYGTETQNILRIFEDKPLLIPSDFDTSANENTTDDEDDDTKSIRSRVWRAKRKLNLTPGLPEDTTYSMREFIQGLDPEMTSTQQSQFQMTSTQQSQFEMTSTQQSDFATDAGGFFPNSEPDDNLQDLEKSSVGRGHDTMSRSSSKKPKKKKKRATIGF